MKDFADKLPEYVQKNAELSPEKGLFAYAFAGRDITGKSVEDIVPILQNIVCISSDNQTRF